MILVDFNAFGFTFVALWESASAVQGGRVVHYSSEGCDRALWLGRLHLMLGDDR